MTLTLDRDELRKSGLTPLTEEEKIDHVLRGNIVYVVLTQGDLNERLIRYQPAPMQDDGEDTGKEHLVQIVLRKRFDGRKQYLCQHKYIWFELYKGLTLSEMEEREMYYKKEDMK